MAPAYRTSAVGGSSTGTTDRTVAITGALDDLFVVCGVFATNTNTAPTASDSLGGQYVLVHAGLHNAGADMHCMFVRAGPVCFASSHTITVATGSNTAGEVVAVAVSGMQRWGTDAIKQSAFQDAQAAGTPAPAFGASALTGNVTVGMVANATNPATMTAPSGWTERQDVGQTANNAGIEVVTRDSGFTGTTVTWGSASASAFGAIIIELDSSAPVAFPGNASAAQRLFNVAPTTGTQDTPTITTPGSGSTILVAAARGTWANDGSAPTENMGNTLTALASTPHAYNGFPTSEAGIWGCAGANGGAGHKASLVWGMSSAGSGDEVTVSLVEIDSMNTIQASAFADDSSNANTETSGSVTTTGAAILIAYFWGYGNTGQLHNYRPQNDGWRRLDAACTDGDPVGAAGYIQCTVLWKQVSGAGSYNCVASGVAQEAAMTWIVAVQQVGGTAFTANVSETVTLSESVGVGMASIVGPSETVTVSESLAGALGAIAGINETVPLSEAVGAGFAATVAPAETVTLSESVAASRGTAVALSETVSWSEALAAGLLLTANVSETITLSESLNAAYAAIVSPSETVTLTEALSTAAAFATSVAETVTLTEQLVAGLLYTIGVAETVTLSESLNGRLGAITGLSETVALTEAIGTFSAFTSALSETVALTEQLSGGLQFTANLVETVALSEAISVARAALVGIAETVTLVESLATHQASAVNVSEIVTLLEQLTASASGAVTTVLDIFSKASAVIVAPNGSAASTTGTADVQIVTTVPASVTVDPQ